MKITKLEKKRKIQNLQNLHETNSIELENFFMMKKNVN